MTKKTKSPVHPSDELAAIDEELNAAMELVDLTNVKVTEILGTTDLTGIAPGAGTAEAEDDDGSGEDADEESPEPKSKAKKSE